MQSELCVSSSFMRSVVVCATDDRSSRTLYGASGTYLRRNKEHAYVSRYIEFIVKVLHRFVCKRILQYFGSNIIINQSFWNIFEGRCKRVIVKFKFMNFFYLKYPGE
jgi:hypothetical protein